ncbi:reverse transcriptase family protein [Thomasclavelia cocleata]|uniref:reverse transcriptase family protein n=1 Tax=Thomasclavelia cocleata TaxID=69824 RepID=UPI0025A1FBBA|nr:reverse transcriptase family protein [Thomasclavelia cocleata]
MIIYSEKVLSKILDTSINEINDIAASISDHTKEVTIIRNGKSRIVIKTSNALRSILKKINIRILSTFSVHPSAYGGVKGKSTKLNALQHQGNPYIFQTDLTSCFNNIPSKRVRILFQKKLKFPPKIANILTRLTTYNYSIPLGYPTSIALVNLIALDMDTNLYNYCSSKKIVYTRFVDDMTFSGKYISERTQKAILDIIKRNKFKINSKKTVFSQGNKTVLITGINVRRKKLFVNNKIKNNLRLLHYRKKFLSSDARKKLIRTINGKINYINSIEK